MAKKITLEDLAGMVARGFEQTATKQELQTLATKQDLLKAEERLSDRIQGVRDELLSLKIDIIRLNRLEQRVSQLEEALNTGR